MTLSPLMRRRLHQFRANRRGYWSLWIFLALFGVSLLADLIANDRPLVIRYDGRLGWQGIVPSRADKMASISVDKGLAKLGSISDFYRELEPDKIAADCLQGLGEKSYAAAVAAGRAMSVERAVHYALEPDSRQQRHRRPSAV